MGATLSTPREQPSQPAASSPTPLSLKDPQLVSKPRAASYKALPLLSLAKPPSVAMATEQKRQAALRALPTPFFPTPSAGLWAQSRLVQPPLVPGFPGQSEEPGCSPTNTCVLHRRRGKASHDSSLQSPSSGPASAPTLPRQDLSCSGEWLIAYLVPDPPPLLCTHPGAQPTTLPPQGQIQGRGTVLATEE